MRTYCCYGPIANSFKKLKHLEKDTVSNFSNGLLRLCELTSKAKKLLHAENEALPSILPAGAKITEIVLICNWFESHKVIGPIHTALAAFVEASQGIFIAPGVDVEIIGPTEFSQRYFADELALYAFHSRVMTDKS